MDKLGNKDFKGWIKIKEKSTTIRKFVVSKLEKFGGVRLGKMLVVRFVAKAKLAQDQ